MALCKKIKITQLILFVLLTIGHAGCYSQNKEQETMSVQNNPLMCDPESGICEIPADTTQPITNAALASNKKPLKIIYFTDPICSSCWGIEPQLRKLKLEYGNNIEVEYKMGGLLPDWSYNSGGISKPSDVAHHWDEVSLYYDMPIDGDVWLEDPLHSSYPPSIAFKAAQMQSNEKAILFLRALREMVFLRKKNITKWEYLEQAAKQAGLDVSQLKTDYEGNAKEHFQEDLKAGRESGVRGFPTLFFMDTTGRREIVYGSQPYPAFETALLKLYPAAPKNNYDKTWHALFSKFQSLTAKEFAELAGMDRKESEALLNKLTESGTLEKLSTKNGSIWTLKQPGR